MNPSTLPSYRHDNKSIVELMEPSTLPSYWDDNKSIVELMERRQKSKTATKARVPKSKSKTVRKSPPSSTPLSQKKATTFVFFSRSADKKPGKGEHEHVDANLRSKYEALSKEKNWRRVLSNFDECPFVFEGKRYRTIEHVFQSKKIAIADPGEADKFTMDSGDEIGQGDGAFAQKHRKLVKLTLQQLQQWENMREDVMERAAKTKYDQCPEKLRILKLTDGAELFHLMTERGKQSKLVRFEHLERIRDQV
jgi:hypothetical protein